MKKLYLFMSKTLFFLLLFQLFFVFQKSDAQDTIPFLKGKVNISITKGTIECDFILSNIPKIEDYVIRLNTGMNLRYIKNLKQGNLLVVERDRDDTMSVGESLGYYFGSKKRKYLPEELQFRYIGMYPVVTDTSDMATEDWRGNLAFNGYTLRVDGIQSAWYPVLYDMKNQIRYQKVKYDIDISCPDCNTLYVNGNKPVKAKQANFKSSLPNELALYCGNYDFIDINGVYILNPDMDKKQLQDFINFIDGVKSYYGTQLKVPYGGNFTFVQTTPTAKGYGFSFLSSPTIFNVGTANNSLSQLFHSRSQFIAHELAHYYFGTVLGQNTEFGPIINEGFAEFLSFKAIKSLVGDSVYQKLIAQKIQIAKSFKPIVSFAQFRKKEDFNSRERYVYSYAPVIFTAIEKEIGEENIWKWMNTMLVTKTSFTNYEFFEKTLAETLNDNSKLNLLKTKYLDSDRSLENAIEVISKK